MKALVIAGGWVLTLAAAFVVGRALRGDAPAGGEPSADAGEVARLEQRVKDLTLALAKERSRVPRAEARERERGDESAAPSADAAREPRPGAAAAAGGTPEPLGAFSLEGVASAPDLSKRLMAFVEAQLGRGPEGHAAILEALNTLWRNEEALKGLLSDEATASRELYPWIRLLVTREAEVLDLAEHVFRTMAEKPEAFADTPDNDVLEIFTEGFGFLLPGAVPEERLERFRGYAARILETPEASQPKAVRGNRSKVERLLTRFWAPPLTTEQAVEKLRRGGLPAGEVTRLLRNVPPDALAEIDVTSLLAPLVRDGNYEVFRVLGSAAAQRIDAARLDEALLESFASGKGNPPFAGNYFRLTGRKQWSDVRPFFDRAFGSNEASAAAAAQTLASSLPRNLRPEAAYVQDLLARTTLPEPIEKMLRAAYGL